MERFDGYIGKGLKIWERVKEKLYTNKLIRKIVIGSISLYEFLVGIMIGKSAKNKPEIAWKNKNPHQWLKLLMWAFDVNGGRDTAEGQALVNRVY